MEDGDDSDLASSKKKVRNDDEMTSHHMVPRSRLTKEEKAALRGLKISNHKRVKHGRHELWHHIFVNMTPFEAIVCIVEHFAKECVVRADFRAKLLSRSYKYRFTKRGKAAKPGQFVKHYRMSDKQRERLFALFPGKDWVGMIAEIVEEWAPEGYFVKVEIKIAIDGEESVYSYDQFGQE